MAFVVFEGADGAGKTTLIKAFARALGKRGISCKTTKEPGGSVLGRKIRRLLLSGGHAPLSKEAEALLCYADRSQNILENIRPALSAGQWVISDRYYASTKVYQETAGGCSKGLSDFLAEKICKNTAPHLWILVDTPLKYTLPRLGKKDRFEAQSLDFHKKVKAGYRKLAQARPEKWLVVSGAWPVEKSLQRIFSRLQRENLLEA